MKVLCFLSSFQNLGIRCVKKKEVKEAIISRIRAGINPFNGKYALLFGYWLICVISICILNVCFKSYLKFFVHFSTCWLTAVSEEWSIFKSFTVLQKNFHSDKTFLYLWKMPFFFIRKPQKTFWFSFNVTFLLPFQQTTYTPFSECWTGTVVVLLTEGRIQQQNLN